MSKNKRLSRERQMNKVIDAIFTGYPALAGLGIIALFVAFGFIERHYDKDGINVCWLWAGGMAIAFLVKMVT